jgi:hypothetical protein
VTRKKFSLHRNFLKIFLLLSIKFYSLAQIFLFCVDEKILERKPQKKFHQGVRGHDEIFAACVLIFLST